MKVNQDYTGTTLDALNEGVVVTVADADVVTFDVTGTFTGTLTLQVSVDGTTYVTTTGLNVGSNSLVTTLTSAGVARLTNCQGFETARLRFTAYTDGSALVKWQTARTSK